MPCSDCFQESGGTHAEVIEEKERKGFVKRGGGVALEIGLEQKSSTDPTSWMRPYS